MAVLGARDGRNDPDPISQPTPVAEPDHTAVPVPPLVLNTLISLGLRTEIGAALVLGFRAALPHVSPELGQASISVDGPGTLVLEPPADAGGR
ncbi:MAG: hypothetical protein EBQ56_00245 [Proteobacteria bacterium]|nr:hypothetical protein [Pseudomonadota bacterium]